MASLKKCTVVFGNRSWRTCCTKPMDCCTWAEEARNLRRPQGTKNDAIGRGAIHVYLLAVSKRKVAEVYAYARSAGGLDDEDSYLKTIWINEFLCARVRRDFDTSVDAYLVGLKRKRTCIQRFQSHARLVQIYVRSVPVHWVDPCQRKYACLHFRCCSRLSRALILQAQSEGYRSVVSWETQTLSLAMLPRAKQTRLGS